MKNILLGFILGLLVPVKLTPLLAQKTRRKEELYTQNNKGKFFVYWGWNRAHYSSSDIHFTGSDYDFTVHDAPAHDKPLKLSYNDYFRPDRVTIPQTNVRIGYFFSNHYAVSLGIDHMKYVLTNGRTAAISGNINVTGEASIYNGTYDRTPTLLSKDFIQFEHTDGLNYVNAEIARYDDIAKLFGWNWNTDIVQLNITEAIGAGALVPKTNATILNRERHDDFHLSGFGISAKAGLNLTFLKHFFIQADIKQGYINMQDIRTTQSSSDKASQHFTFTEQTISFGGIFRL
ncbi:MAG TPA: hypothetical protein ENH91_11035 [Leeuwenhoekiella sp.]|nr:hypothetical protein [Leeuwenhoekiella sp.]